MTPSKMNVAYSFFWSLSSGTPAQVREIVEQLRERAIELGSSEVSDVVELTRHDAEAVRPQALHIVMFAATVPNAKSEPSTSPQQYGLLLPKDSPDETSWPWSGIVRVSSFKEISQLMVAAAKLGIEVRTTFAGMTMSYRRNEDGEIVGDQKYGFNPETF